MARRFTLVQSPRRPLFSWRGYLAGLVLVTLATLAGYLVHTFFAPANILMIYLLGVSVTAVIGGFGPSAAASILSVLAFDFFFVTPYYTFAIDDTQYIFTFAVLLLVGVTISYLTSSIRRQTEAAELRERETATLYALGKDLAIAGDLASYVQAIRTRFREALERDVTLYMANPEGKGWLKRYPGGRVISGVEPEPAAVLRSFQHRERLVSPNGVRCLPLVTARRAVGVLALDPASSDQMLDNDQENLLDAYTDLVAVALEGIQLAEQVRDAQVVKATEKLQAALLNALSHDLRTPLVSIIGTLSSLQEERISLEDATRRNLVQMAHEEAERLNRLIDNLLNESRIEAGALQLSRQPSELQDLVGAALEQLGERAWKRAVRIAIPEELPFITVDFSLMVHTLANVLDNAIKFSPDESPLEITAGRTDSDVWLDITDHGIGVPEEDLNAIFDKFYRIKRPHNPSGTGLGLSIARGIVEAHGGAIEARQTPGGGTTVRITLPLATLARSVAG